MDPIPLFFLLGFLARLARSDLKLPAQLYEALSIYLLLAIGLKGGTELASQKALQVLPQAISVMGLGVLIPLVADHCRPGDHLPFQHPPRDTAVRPYRETDLRELK